MLASAVALLLAVPVAIGVALFITQYAPAAAGRSRSRYLIDLLAAIPSIIYGLWGIRVLGPVIAGPGLGGAPFLETRVGLVPAVLPDRCLAGNGVPRRRSCWRS